ncbi:hypothetical protein [Streptomyces albogriseolus]|uniref:hypothetical protein n=1 Tax=Streptomyces albogriseolus TaxID=1887 RepID=UPI003460E6B0
MNATTATTAPAWIARAKEAATEIAEAAANATGDACTELWNAASLLSILGYDMADATLADVADIAARADEAAARGNYSGPRYAPELTGLRMTA